MNFHDQKKQKHLSSEHMGQTADMIVQFSRTKVELPTEKREGNIIIESVIEADYTEYTNEFVKLPNSTWDIRVVACLCNFITSMISDVLPLLNSLIFRENV